MSFYYERYPPLSLPFSCGRASSYCLPLPSIPIFFLPALPTFPSFIFLYTTYPSHFQLCAFHIFSKKFYCYECLHLKYTSTFPSYPPIHFLSVQRFNTAGYTANAFLSLQKACALSDSSVFTLSTQNASSMAGQGSGRATERGRRAT